MARRTTAGIHTSTGNDEWLTPPEIAEVLDRVGVAFDPCGHERALFRASIVANLRDGVDGLDLPWHEAEGLVFVNMPFSALLAWYRKAREEHEKGAEILCLSPARLETEAFHAHVYGHAAAMLAIDHRLVFHEVREDGSVGPRIHTDAKGRKSKLGSTFSSVLVYYGNNPEIIDVFSHLGYWIPTKVHE